MVWEVNSGRGGGGPACLNREGTGVDVDRDIEETVDLNEWAIAINKGFALIVTLISY